MAMKQSRKWTFYVINHNNQNFEIFRFTCPPLICCRLLEVEVLVLRGPHYTQIAADYWEGHLESWLVENQTTPTLPRVMVG